MSKLYMWKCEGSLVVAAGENLEEARKRAAERYDVGSDYRTIIETKQPTYCQSSAIVVFDGTGW